MAATPDNDKKQVMDVAKPGQVAASPTTRPIIVNHGGIMKDPMVTEAASAPKAVAPSELSSSPDVPAEAKSTALPSHKVIQPLTINKPAEEAKKPEESAAAKEPEAETEESSGIDGSDEAIVDAVIGQAAGKKKEGELTAEEMQQLETIEKLVEDKTYFVPIGQVSRRRRRYAVLVIIFVLLLAAAGAAYAYKTGLIKLNNATPTAQPAAPAPISPASPVVAKQAAPKLTEFMSKDLGIKFSYPEEWGAVSVTDNAKETTEKGKRAKLSFAKQPKVTVGLKSATWKDTSKDVQRACTQPGFIAYLPVKTDLDNGLRVVNEKADRQVYEQLDGGLCGDKLLLGNVKSTKPTQYAGVSVQYLDTVTDKLDLAQRIADYKKDYNKYFSDSLRQQIVALTNSLTEL